MIRFISNVVRAAAARVKGSAAAAVDAVARFLRPSIRLVKVESEFPKRLKPHTLYVLLEDGVPWQATMICPCGCAQTLDMNLLPDEKPCWRFSSDRMGRASLHPSVWRKIGCHSHFWVRQGRIIWAIP